MEINRKTFPGLYWLGRCFASLLAVVFLGALTGNLKPGVPGPSVLSRLGILWICAIVLNVPKYIGWCLDWLWRTVVLVGGFLRVKFFLKSLNFGLSFLVAFYTAFVLTMLWDWFVTPAFHVEEIGYWNMCGLVLIVRLFAPSAEVGFLTQQWERAMKMLEACIPEEKRLETMRAVENDALSVSAQLFISNAFGAIGGTASLVIGWVIHTFLM
jgi:hypothetical protein